MLIGRGMAVRLVCKEWYAAIQGNAAFWGLVYVTVDQELPPHGKLYAPPPVPMPQDTTLLKAYDVHQERAKKHSGTTNKELGMVKRKISNREHHVETLQGQLATYKKHRIDLESIAAEHAKMRAVNKAAARKLRKRMKNGGRSAPK